MQIVLVHIQVKAEAVDAFISATLENTRNSVLEPGIARFDFIQETEDPTRFILVEVYRTPDAALRHKETAHYLNWRDQVAEMMQSPRKGVKYSSIFPEDGDW